MSTRHYSVETRSQAALIIGEGSGLVPHLLAELKTRGIYGVTPSTPEALNILIETHDLDYLVLLSPHTLPFPLISPLQSLLQTTSTRLVVVHHLGEPMPPIPLTPLSLELIHCDYLESANSYFSPILSNWISQLSTSRSLTIPGDGLAEVGLLSVSDLARGIASAITTPHPTHGTQLLLSSVNPLSILNLAYTLRSAAPYKIHISFSPEQIPPVSPIDLSAPLFTWDQTTDLPNLLSLFLKSLPTHAPTQQKSPQHPPAPATRLTRLSYPQPVFVPLTTPRSHKSLIKLLPRLRRSRPPTTPASSFRHIVGRGLIIALALYFGSLAFAVTISMLSLRQLTQQNHDQLPSTSKLTHPATTYLQANLYVFSLIPGVTRLTPVADTLLLLDSYHQFLTALATARDLSSTTNQLMRNILGEEQGDLVQLISQSRLSSEQLYQQLSYLDGTLPATSPTIIPTRYHDNYLTAKKTLGSLKRSILMTKAVLATLPDLIGVGGRRKYAVLFQNNMELRATGGFIGSFAILNFDNGQLYDMPIYDVYQADGQLKGHVEPPLPIKEILGEANWFLRDSNFDPDFPVSARRAEWFIQKTLNQELDGTFALNLHTLNGLLSATGPLELTDYNETINANNLYERAQYHAEVNFFPGSTQKKEFLSSVGNAIFAKLSSLSQASALPLATNLLQSIEEKNLLLSVTNTSTEHILSTLGWTGELQVQPDSTMIVDSNFGVNKANYYLRRDTQVIITLAKDLTLNHTLRLRYTNTATSNSWPAGVYKNYSRIYLPAGSVVREFKVGDRQLKTTEYSVTTERNHTVVAHLLTVPINSTLGVELDYQVPRQLTPNALQYSWYWQKQPGTSSNEPLTVYLNYPLFLKPTLISPAAEVGVQQLKFNFQNDTDHRLSVNFIQ